MTSCNTHDGNDEFADTHSSSADEEEPSAPDAINELNAENCRDGTDDICNNPAALKKNLSRE